MEITGIPRRTRNKAPSEDLWSIGRDITHKILNISTSSLKRAHRSPATVQNVSAHRVRGS